MIPLVDMLKFHSTELSFTCVLNYYILSGHAQTITWTND